MATAPCQPPTGAHPARRGGDYQVGTVLYGYEAGVASASGLKTLYGKRWSIECGPRDTKDLRFGMGMGSIHVSTPARPGRL